MLLKLNNIVFKYPKKKTPIFKGLDLELYKNESVAIMAGSGSGKTTLFKILTKYLTPTSGSVTYSDEIFIKDFSYIKQTPMDMLFPWKTVQENINFPLKEREEFNEENKRYVKNLINKLKIGHLLDSKPKSLSGGEQKRVSIACGLSYLPKIILLDEAFTGIDMQLKINLWKFFREEVFYKKQTSSLIITHDIDEALFLSNRILFLSKRGVLEKQELKVPKNINYENIDAYFSHPEIVCLKKEVFSVLEKNAL